MDDFSIPGIRLGVAQAGIKYEGRDDLTLIEIAEGSHTAAVFTQNAFRAAPVVVAERHVASQDARYLLINSGNANAGTGQAGMDACERSCVAVATQTSAQARHVLPFSTGVIGEVLPIAKIEAVLPNAVGDLTATNWNRASRAIMTTDTRPKLRRCAVDFKGQSCEIVGMSKGSGMIQPNMATMLGFIATDAGTFGLQATPGNLGTGTLGVRYLWVRYPRVASDTRKSWNKYPWVRYLLVNYPGVTWV